MSRRAVATLAGRLPQVSAAAQAALGGVRQASSTAHPAVEPDVLAHLSDTGLLRTQCYVGGQWIDASDGATLEVLDPSTGRSIARVPRCGANETRAAIAGAVAQFEPWAARPAKERSALLRRWYDAVVGARDDITRLMTLESGKPLAESRGEFDNGVASIEWFAEEAKRTCGDVLESPDRHRRFMVLKQPVGVVGAITPWNFPFSMITRKVSPALAAGCTVVLKPSELTPLTALALAELAERAGLPGGVLSVLTGDAPAIGDAMLKSEEVRKIGFTGSTAVGKQLAAGAAGTVKRVSLELGGNAPFIVFEDADLEKAATAVVASSHRNSGQTCICTNRVLVHERVHDAFVATLTAKVSALRLGSGLEQGVTQGPLISAAAVDRLEEKVADALSKGAVVAVGGQRPKWDAGHSLAGGFFYEPTVLTGARPDMRMFREELFGPVTPVYSFSSDDEAVQLANDTQYGLACYFYTKDLSRAWRVAERLQYGMVGINEVAITSEVAPFGGVKQSGLGREQSKYGLAEFQDIKTVCLGLY
ncbi:succinate-semialdehyde dehydrogenase [Micractinium conductrix]|uniref:Aldehyde dehydrogenase family 5 member F1 n=1 Tax=Micractinium conductrix TaxID=554055 RepID=A0A2P6V3A3_9CHLO|nr:succinate-semialdehyde dehydrogenase [Micractinium conductrix]|eukprot:PSC68568.1 succinate-semialdehyde dehydrogenase [Micractinium conductrix]